MKTVYSSRFSRRTFLKATAAVGASVSLSPALAALQSSQVLAQAPKRGGHATVGIFEDVSSLDPYKQVGFGDLWFSGLATQVLVAGNAKDEFEPVLAERWRVEDGGKTWTFFLRQGARFHNGREVTAAEWKWSFDRLLDPKSGAFLTSVFRGMGLRASVVNRYTLRIQIDNGEGTLLSHLAAAGRAAVLHPDSVDREGDLVIPISTGPFQFVSWRPGNEIRLKRFGGYWQQGDDGNSLPYIDTLTLKVVPDVTTRLNALMAGEVDFIFAPPLSEVKNWVTGRPPAGIAFKRWFYSFSHYLSLNTRRRPFNDVRVRQAVRYAIDREALNEALFFGLGEVHNQPFKRISHWYMQDVPLVKPDLARARRLLEEAGLGGGLDATMLTWIPVNEKMAEVVQAQVAQIGIRARLDKRDVGSFIRHLSTYDWDMATLVIGTIFHPDRPYGYLASTHGAHPFVGGRSDPEVDAMLARGRNEPDLAKAKAIYRQLVMKHVEEAGTPIYLLNAPIVAAFRDYVRNFDGYGYDLVSHNAAMGLHKAWIAK